MIKLETCIHLEKGIRKKRYENISRKEKEKRGDIKKNITAN